MTYAFVQAAFDYGLRKGPALGFVIHMAEGGGTVGYLSRDPARGVSVHFVIEYTGRIVQMLAWGHASGSINPTELRTTDDGDGFYGVTAARAVMGDWWHDPNSAVISVEIEGFAAAGPNPDQVIALQALTVDVRDRYPGIGLLGHRDFTSTKACPGRLIPWALIGGHGPQEDTVQAPITDENPRVVTVAKGATLYDLDGRTALRSLDAALAARTSPYGVGTRRAIFAETPPGSNQRRLVLVTPATSVPPPSPDCTAAVAIEHDKVKAAAVAAAEAIP